MNLDDKTITEFTVKNTTGHFRFLFLGSVMFIVFGSFAMYQSSTMGFFAYLLALFSAFNLLRDIGFKLEVKERDVYYKKNFRADAVEFTLDDIDKIRISSVAHRGKATEYMHITMGEYAIKANSDMENYRKLRGYISSRTKIGFVYGNEKQIGEERQPDYKLRVKGSWGFRVVLDEQNIFVKTSALSRKKQFKFSDIVCIKMQEPAQENRFIRMILITFEEGSVAVTAQMQGFYGFFNHITLKLPDLFVDAELIPDQIRYIK